ncbi:putative monooxygenase CAT5 KNAG_0B04180 [Huiozyma naganishii CBS 8797]|uniref:5-demethoxyubiquinone hydroxylase, mitochondrial n=1 Tax=Huiozyma naganishii (strain ATCC MYA-139 / BCRC 22969 / CBS 8797 / KCTC 17520 / NBRC 10181 / NCYC 3082 / Yp74L-3) TaxID=1071383 RepID=J7RH36_HUIN7|nr:hypothetical protein KNAG_0B04180 [Kazachstania naganishii CBS 8797]CCK68853.1 hypothetical protein KNAG_0B04180 [Kazachstania naganishii CBS 8797]
MLAQCNFLKSVPVGVRAFSSLNALRATPKKGTLKAGGNALQESKFEPLSEAQRAYLDRALRVNQAGELGANYIYQGQIFVLSRRHPELRPTLQHMWEQEVFHHDTFNALQIKHRVRPSLLTPFWKVGAVAMGAGTALISPEAAMACTEAVETVIGGHYNEQLRCLDSQFEQRKADGTSGVPEEVQSLTAKVKLFRDQELEHLDTAIKHDSRLAVPYMMITETIKGVCRLAIWGAERI